MENSPGRSRLSVPARRCKHDLGLQDDTAVRARQALTLVSGLSSGDVQQFIVLARRRCSKVGCFQGCTAVRWQWHIAFSATARSKEGEASAFCQTLLSQCGVPPNLTWRFCNVLLFVTFQSKLDVTHWRFDMKPNARLDEELPNQRPIQEADCWNCRTSSMQARLLHGCLCLNTKALHCLGTV